MQAAIPNILGPSKPEVPDLTGKVAVVTGGALGIGFEVAKALALKGCKVILVNRKEEQGDDAKLNIAQASDSKAEAEWVHCDLGNLKEVRETFTKLAEQEKRLDYLVLAAGINSNQYALDADGLERIFAVNWLGHFYAINLLYPLMQETAKSSGTKPRIVFESSEMHRFASKNTHFASKEEVNDDKLGPVELYARTKLAMILGAKYIHENIIKKNGDDIYILSVHPGTVATTMQQQWEEAYPGIGKMIKWLTLALSRSPEQGAYSGIYALVSPEVESNQWNGYYLSDPATPGKETEQGADMELSRSLWNLSTKLVNDIVGKDALNKL